MTLDYRFDANRDANRLREIAANVVAENQALMSQVHAAKQACRGLQSYNAALGIPTANDIRKGATYFNRRYYFAQKMDDKNALWHGETAARVVLGEIVKSASAAGISARIGYGPDSILV